VLWSDADVVFQTSSGAEAWLHIEAFMSEQSEREHSEAVSGGVKGKSMDWHQESTTTGWEKRADPGCESGTKSLLITSCVSVYTIFALQQNDIKTEVISNRKPVVLFTATVRGRPDRMRC